MTSDRDNKNI